MPDHTADATLIAQLVDMIGHKLTAEIAGLTGPRSIQNIIDGERELNPDERKRLESTRRQFRKVTERFDALVAYRWLLGAGESVDDTPPLVLLREGKDSRARRSMPNHPTVLPPRS